MFASTSAMADGKMDRARAAVAEARGKVDAAARAGTGGVAPRTLTDAQAALRAAEDDLKASRKDQAIVDAQNASRLADLALNETQRAQADKAAADKAASDAQAADAARAASDAEARARAAEADAQAARNAPPPAPVIIAAPPAPPPDADQTTVTTSTSDAGAGDAHRGQEGARQARGQADRGPQGARAGRQDHHDGDDQDQLSGMGPGRSLRTRTRSRIAVPSPVPTSKDVAHLFRRPAEHDALRGFDQRALDQDRVGDHRVEDRVVARALERLGGVLAGAQPLARGQPGAGVERGELVAARRVLEIIDDLDVGARRPAGSPASRATSSSADCARSSPSCLRLRHEIHVAPLGPERVQITSTTTVIPATSASANP